MTLSSTTPLQSSSTPLQISVCGWPGVALQYMPFAPQTLVPSALQDPAPTLHGSPSPRMPLSTLPSQSSSRPLQSSAVGITPEHSLQAPPLHVRLPVVHAPTSREQVSVNPGSLHGEPVSTTHKFVPGSQLLPSEQIPPGPQCGTIDLIC